MKTYPYNKNWTRYLERKSPIIVFYVSNWVYGEGLKEATGFGFRHQLHTYTKGVGVFFRLPEELEKADNYFFTLIKKNSKKLKLWSKLGHVYNRQASNFFKYFNSNTPIDSQVFSHAVDIYINSYLYGTVIPYRVLSAANKALERNSRATYQKKNIAPFVRLRAKTQYPVFAEKIWPLIWQDIARRSGQNSHSVSYMTIQECLSFYQEGKKVSSRELKKREQGCIFWKDGKNNIIFSYDKKKIQQFKDMASSGNARQLTGSVSYKGCVQGRVCIVNTSSEMSKFKKGDILVSINTSPSLMPIIHKCAAIVADEGGIMSHAAIVAREFKIPCITATKIATKIFKNGDMVEVDANKGIVRKIS